MVIYRSKYENTMQGNFVPIEVERRVESSRTDWVQVDSPSQRRSFFVHYNYFKEELSWTY